MVKRQRACALVFIYSFAFRSLEGFTSGIAQGFWFVVTVVMARLAFDLDHITSDA